MASTEQVRRWYHEGVVLNHAQRGTAGYTPICNHNHPKVAFPNDTGGVYNEPVHPLTVEAFRAYVTVMDYHGETMPSGGGVNQCRNIAGTAWPSLHAYLCAVDLPPNSRKSNAFIADIESIRTNSGAQVFQNLSGDRMHDQINCSPADLATGIDPSTVRGYEGDDEMWSKNLDEAGWRELAKAGIAAGTETAVVEYWWTQRSQRTDEEHRNASRSMSAVIAVKVAAGGGGVGPQGPPGPQGPAGPQGPIGPEGPGGSLLIKGAKEI